VGAGRATHALRLHGCVCGWDPPPLLPQMLKGHGSTLFGFIADAVKAAHPPPGASVGFTFSFPVNQTSINSGTLNHWTKECVQGCGEGGRGDSLVAQLRLQQPALSVLLRARALRPRAWGAVQVRVRGRG
jgi:hypothetical protein